INHDGPGLRRDRVIIRPTGKHRFGRVAQENLDPLIVGKIKLDRTLANIRHNHPHLKLTNLGEPDRCRCDLQVENETAQAHVLVFGRGPLRRAKWMQNPAEPTPLLRSWLREGFVLGRRRGTSLWYRRVGRSRGGFQGLRGRGAEAYRDEDG